MDVVGGDGELEKADILVSDPKSSRHCSYASILWVEIDPKPSLTPSSPCYPELSHDLAVVRPRDVLVHNHPSGDPTPSDADIRVTRELARAGQLLKIEVLDHLILGIRTEERLRDYVSLRELGYFAL